MFQTMTEEQLRELIQGPQDVEWKYARCLSFRSVGGSQSLTPDVPLSPRRIMTDTKCAGSARKSFQVSFWDHYKPQNRSISSGDSESLMCTPPYSTPLQLAIGVTNSTERARSLSPQGVHSRRERSVLRQTTVPRYLQIYGRGSRGFGGTESHPVLSSVRTFSVPVPCHLLVCD